MNIKAIIFDLDGTLINPVRDYATTANDVLNSYDFPTHTLQDYQSFLGNGMLAFVQSILPSCYEPGSRVFEKCFDQFKRIYATNCCIDTTPYAGIFELLNELNGLGIPMSILTNKPQAITLKIVKAYLDQWNFVQVMGKQELFPQKPAPNGALHVARSMGVVPKEIALVGDTPIDMHTAQNAGMQAVGAGWGFRSAEELLEAGAHKVLTEPKELIKLITSEFVIS